MAFELPSLPYDKNALAPHMSAETFDYHYGKHHKTYVDNLNNLVKDKPEAAMSLEDIITSSANDASKAGLFNNSAQVWNHTFFWSCMKPNGGGAPTGALADKIAADFGSFDAFKEAFTQAALTQFGSGWAWLVLENGKLSVTKTPNAGTPLTTNAAPLLTVDVWEHAYYIDYRNARAGFVKAFLDHLVNWDFVSANFAAASK
jgi:Fe-Mn family superoxide dismutase